MDQMRNPENESALAGFRLVRRIGTGSRSTVYLGQARDVHGQAMTVALKVFRPDADRAALDRQVRAMLALPPAMLAPLRDVATAPDGRLCLVMDRLAGSPLDRLLAERGRIGSGEVVTIAATITAALQALHDAGFSHPMIGADCVRFDGGGRPVLLGLGALEELPAGGAGVARRRDDLVRLAGWVRSLLEHLDPAAPDAATAGSVLAEFEAAATARPFPADLSAVEAALFAWAPATAVRGAVPGAVPGGVDPDPRTPAGPATASRTLTRPARPVAVPVAAGRERDRPPGARGRSPVQLVPRRVLVRVLEVRDALWADGARRPGTRRWAARPVLVGVCLAAVLSAGSLAVLSWADSPSASGESTDLPAPAASTDAAEPAEQPDEQRDEQPDGDVRGGRADLGATLGGDDPAAATLALLRERERCLAAASVLCLDGVDQAGSVAMAADSYRVRQATAAEGESADGAAGVAEGTVLEEPGFTATIQERRGNAALIVLTPAAGAPHTQPASALVIRGEAGWRLRELFDY